MKSDTDMVTIPYVVHEDAMHRYSRQFKMLWSIIIGMLALLVASIAMLLWHTKRFERADNTARTDNVHNNNNN